MGGQSVSPPQIHTVVDLSYKFDPSYQLRRAAFYNDVENVRKVVQSENPRKKSSRWLNKFDAFGWSALHYACFQGNLTVCQELIQAGADPNLRTERAYETPLFLAAAMNEHHIVEHLLFRHHVDPNLADITGRIPLEVSYGRSRNILSQERLRHGKLIRSIPTVRKLLASKFTQLLLQLILCVFLELFQEKLVAVLHKAIHLLVLLGPGVRQFLVGVFDRMLGPIFTPIVFLISPVLSWLIKPLFIVLSMLAGHLSHLLLLLLRPFWDLMVGSLWSLVSPLVWSFQLLVLPVLQLLGGVSSSLVWFVGQVGSSLLLTTKALWPITQRVLLPFKLLLRFFWASLKSSMIYAQIARSVSAVSARTWRLFLFTLQPRQLAGKLVSPIILGASKLLYIFPAVYVDTIASYYMRFAGKSRHVSDEEVATATLFLSGLGVYLLGILGGGYLFRLVLFSSYHFNVLYSELHSLGTMMVVFQDSNYTTFHWMPDGFLHELGMVFTVIVLPLLLVVRLLIYLSIRLYRWWERDYYRRESAKRLQDIEREEKPRTFESAEAHRHVRAGDLPSAHTFSIPGKMSLSSDRAGGLRKTSHQRLEELRGSGDKALRRKHPLSASMPFINTDTPSSKEK